MPTPFDRQAVHLVGKPMGVGGGWEDTLFTRLREAVEITAIQRGLERWAPRMARAIVGEVAA
jgi:hypothetical protein